MPKIKQLSAGAIHVFSNDHPPPHFHVRANDGKSVKLHIPTLRVLVGAVDPKLRKEAEVWAAANMKLLQAKWKQLNP